MSQENVELVRRAFEAFDRRDLSVAADCLDPNVEWDNSVLIDEEVIHGRQAVLAYWEGILATLPFAHEEHRFIDAGERVCVITRLRARGAGSEVERTAPGAYVMEVAHEAIVRSRFFADQAKALEAVGLPGVGDVA